MLTLGEGINRMFLEEHMTRISHEGRLSCSLSVAVEPSRGKL